MPIGQRARGISSSHTHSLARTLFFWATECPRSGIMGCDGIYVFINISKEHEPTFHRLCVLSLFFSLAYTESVGDFIFEVWLLIFFLVGVCDSSHWQKVALVNSLVWVVPGFWGWDIHFNGKQSHGKKEFFVTVLFTEWFPTGAVHERQGLLGFKSATAWQCEANLWNINIRGKNKGLWTCRCNASETLGFKSFAV